MIDGIYRTTELEIAAFLKAKGFQVLEVKPEHRLVTFGFAEAASAEAEAYFVGAALPARELFEAHRHLRTVIQQIKEHRSQTIGADQNHGTIISKRQ